MDGSECRRELSAPFTRDLWLRFGRGPAWGIVAHDYRASGSARPLPVVRLHRRARVRERLLLGESARDALLDVRRRRSARADDPRPADVARRARDRGARARAGAAASSPARSSIGALFAVATRPRAM